MSEHLRNIKKNSILILFLLALILPNFSYSIINPASAYCQALGYETDIKDTELGQVGICVFPDGSSSPQWDFLRGRESLEWSYCEQEGYEAKHVEDSEICKECTACVLSNGTEIEVTKLMELSFQETTCGDGTCGLPENYETCPEDCPSGSYDSYCDEVEDGICDQDCLEQKISEQDPDCPICGNNICENDENENNCLEDCLEVEDGVEEEGFPWLFLVIGGVILILIVLVFIVTKRPSQKDNFKQLKQKWG